jgi:hypothetical protein
MLAVSIFCIFWIVKRNLRGFIVFMAVFKAVNFTEVATIKLQNFDFIVVKLGEKV